MAPKTLVVNFPISYRVCVGARACVCMCVCVTDKGRVCGAPSPYEFGPDRGSRMHHVKVAAVL